MYMRCVACNTHTSNVIDHKQADDGQVWVRYQCLTCKTKWNVHFESSNREVERLLKSGYKLAAIRLNMRGCGNSLRAARTIVEQIEYWLKQSGELKSKQQAR